PGQLLRGSVRHGSILNENFRPYRVSSRWKSTANNVTLDFSRPGKPTDNAFIEAFNGRLRAECLNAHWFLTRADAREKLEAWRRDYNEVRPHGAIGNRTPISLHLPGDAPSPLP
ncbi:integrase core domain-containing protein, partial [Gluconacetobacter diazotrophicus]|uniref:integrase core domain-containing protein n=1 Tax=Gluconacetobacter diazotrophicus TaxID=33996 RepID=UPI0021BD07DD